MVLDFYYSFMKYTGDGKSMITLVFLLRKRHTHRDAMISMTIKRGYSGVTGTLYKVLHVTKMNS